MNKSFFARSLHKWFGLIVGLQVLIWLATGLYMVVLDMDFIHGDPLVRNMQRTVTVPDSSQVSVTDLRAQYPDATDIGLQPVMEASFFTVITPENRYLISPQSAQVISPLDEEIAGKIAVFHFNGEASIREARLITSDPPREIGPRRLPLWRVDFNDRYSTSFYIDPYSGALVTRRHRYWRVFDFFFMLHIMDYGGRQNFNNTLIIVVALIAIWLGLSGFILLFGSFKRKDFNFLKLLRRRDEVLVTLIDPVVSTPQQVRLQQGGNLFLSLAANNITLPSNCGGDGSCGLCLVQMESSELEEPNAAERDHIPAHLLHQGFRLACQHEVAHSITLRLAEGTIASKGLTATVREARYITPFIKEILLECDQPLSYAAGSYFQIRIPLFSKVTKPMSKA